MNHYYELKPPRDHEEEIELEDGLFCTNGIVYIGTLDWLLKNHDRVGGIAWLKSITGSKPLFSYEIIMKDDLCVEYNEDHGHMMNELYQWKKMNGIK